MKKNYYNYKGEVFRIKIDDYKKIEQYGEDAGKYLTFNKEIGAYELTDKRTGFNADRTWKYIHKDEQFDMYKTIACSLGYLYTEDEYLDFRAKTK